MPKILLGRVLSAGAALGLVLLRRAVGPLGLAATVKMHARMVLASLVALSVTWAGLPLLPSTLGDTWLEAVIVLALFGCLYVALAWAIAHRLRVPEVAALLGPCLLYTSPSPRDRTRSRMPSSA